MNSHEGARERERWKEEKKGRLNHNTFHGTKEKDNERKENEIKVKVQRKKVIKKATTGGKERRKGRKERNMERI